MLDNAENIDRRQVGNYWPQQSKRFSRLFALGIDAYRLIPSLRRLLINPEERARHHTGELSVDSSGRIKRSLMMATYIDGKARLLETPDTRHLSATPPAN